MLGWGKGGMGRSDRGGGRGGEGRAVFCMDRWIDGRIAGIADGVRLELTSVYWLVWRLCFG